MTNFAEWQKIMSKIIPLVDIFWRDVEVADKCWIWRGRTHRGYGKLSYTPASGERKKDMFAHRASWLLHYGELPLGKCVLHKCDNPSCVNPIHLFLGTHDDNMKDMAVKGRGNNQNRGKTHCKHGHQFNEINTGTYTNGKRYCRTCKGWNGMAKEMK